MPRSKNMKMCIFVLQILTEPLHGFSINLLERLQMPHPALKKSNSAFRSIDVYPRHARHDHQENTNGESEAVHVLRDVAFRNLISMQGPRRFLVSHVVLHLGCID